MKNTRGINRQFCVEEKNDEHQTTAVTRRGKGWAPGGVAYELHWDGIRLDDNAVRSFVSASEESRRAKERGPSFGYHMALALAHGSDFIIDLKSVMTNLEPGGENTKQTRKRIEEIVNPPIQTADAATSRIVVDVPSELKTAAVAASQGVNQKLTPWIAEAIREKLAR